MVRDILVQITASISELKRNPMAVVAAGDGCPVAILRKNKPVFYCVPASWFEMMLTRIEDIEPSTIADQHHGQKAIRIKLEDL